ncbi:O-antigen ligase [Novosphingobium sp. CECT 9465]|uniref:O-antigen ligase family protein n=1 Tax=Novosphingobium sp. CECT 9465 TaxID=2829794 RepID=UPI001E4C4B90|nr:O-antigen ligase family protein [Novosphingobium sp. CECT 9465]CAH0497930.1 hypothetical protein NVSP9465_03002 [Novosphingobium sp. CECT 9465]
MNVPIASSGRFGPQGPARTVSASAGYRPLLPALILFYAMFMPMEVRFVVAEQTIYPPRMAAFLLLPWLLSKLSRGGLRYRAVDGAMFAGLSWMIISFMAFYDPITGFMRAAPLAFDIFVPYIIGRMCIRNITDFRRFLVYAAPGLMLAGATMAIESLSGRPIIKPFAASIFGRLALYENGVAIGAAKFIEETRLGFLRASGPFAHPILGGIFLGSFVPIYISSGLRGWPKIAGITAGCCAFFSLSSGAFLVLILGIGVLALDEIQKKFEFFGWKLIILSAVFLGTLIQIGSQNGLVSILIRYTLDPATGRYRQYIWKYGSASVEKHPLIGIGLSEWERLNWMGSSVDNNWLLLAMRHGVIVSLLFLYVLLWAIFGIAKTASQKSGTERYFYIGIAAALFAFLVSGFTVTFFGQTLSLYYFMIGAAVCLPSWKNQLGRHAGDVVRGMR